MRVIVADDSLLLREGLVRLLREAGLGVVGQAGNPDDLVALVADARPDVALVDIRMPPTHTDEGVRAAARIRARFPDVGVLLLSQYVDTSGVVRALSREPESFGYLLKDRIADLDELTEAVKRVAAGEPFIDPEVVQRLLGRRRTADALETLTRREREVLALMAEGRSNESITQRLGVGDKTVETHVRNIFIKLGLEPDPEGHRRVLAVLAYLQA
ncbi:response regulator transcription factor [Streptomyces sp. M92]|uniref:response regulator transcription factor n=1 Tax=Streptomyces sp. M92 TaxID=2944250 RepID=UPI00234AA3A0|nr:response regulator transcription factor [Streptomyces sp. M92]WCN05174.1 response regulator transcription factor [Streptomyces sp. M92]